MVNAGFMLLLSGAVLTVLEIAFLIAWPLYLFGASEVTYPYASSYIDDGSVRWGVMLSLGLNPHINCQDLPEPACSPVLARQPTSCST